MNRERTSVRVRRAARLPNHPRIERGRRGCAGDPRRDAGTEPALHRRDSSPDGFRWIIGDDRANSVFAFLRQGEADDPPVLVVSNMTPAPRLHYRVGVPRPGPWREIANTDSRFYGGSDMGNNGGAATAPIASHGEPQSLELTLQPLSTIMLRADVSVDGVYWMNTTRFFGDRRSSTR